MASSAGEIGRTGAQDKTAQLSESAAMHLHNREFDKAREIYEQLLEDEKHQYYAYPPVVAKWSQAVADCWMRMDKPAMAERYWKDSAEITEKETPAQAWIPEKKQSLPLYFLPAVNYTGLANSQEGQGKIADAIENYKHSLVLINKSAYPAPAMAAHNYLGLANCFLSKGHFRQSSADYANWLCLSLFDQDLPASLKTASCNLDKLWNESADFAVWLSQRLHD